MKKHLLTSSCDGGGITRLRNNAFTLIELLAIIVILAIIAVITVPIILNIIDNSKRGAAIDSAYGYKDSINKYYVSELSNNNKLMLNGTYEVKANGVLNGNFGVTENAEDRIIPIDGTKPSSGKLRYSNNVLNAGCVVIGDYKVTFGTDGKVDETVKGNCSTYEFPKSIPTMAEMCPGCKFIFTTDTYGIVGSQYDEYSNMPAEDELTNDYTTLTRTEGHPYFLGLIESTTNPGKIGRIFACGIKNGVPFCLEGGINEDNADEKPVYTSNVGVLNTIFLSCDASTSDPYSYCGVEDDGLAADVWGDVSVDGAGGFCGVESTSMYCSVW